MPFWPFGREPAEIEIVTRVITAATQNGVKVRGKLTLHFSEGQRQAVADAAADRCATVAIALLREAPDPEAADRGRDAAQRAAPLPLPHGRRRRARGGDRRAPRPR